MKKIKLLCFYREKIFNTRGTPIRVKALIEQLSGDPSIDLYVASWDKNPGENMRHINLSNNHFDDIKNLIKFIKLNGIKIVIGHTASSAHYLFFLKFFTKAKIVMEMHGFIEDEAREYGDISPVYFWSLKLFFASVYYMCDLLTTCSISVTNILLKWNKNVITMCGGVDLKYFNPNAISGGYIKKDEKNIVLGYAGNARRWQGVEFLVDTYKKLKDIDSNFRLCMLMSEQWNSEKSVEIVEKLPYEKSPEFLIDCDILIIPRPLNPVTKVSFPSKLSEYLAMGKPIIASNTGDCDSLITHGENGLLYSPGNMNQLIEHILDLKNKEKRLRLGQEAFLTAQELSWAKMNKIFVDSLLKLV